MRAKQIKTTSNSKQEESNRVATKVWQHFAVTIKVKKKQAPNSLVHKKGNNVANQ